MNYKTENHIQHRRTYQRTWYQKHKEKIRKIKRLQYRKNHEKMITYSRTWQRKHKKEINKRNIKRYWKDPESKRIRVRRWYSKNKDKINSNRQTKEHKIQAKKYKDKLKLMVLSHYSKGKLKCVCCNEKELAFLLLHHANGGGNEHRRQLKGKTSIGNSFYQYLKSNNFPNKPPLQVICANCHFAITHLGYCPHKKKVKKWE